MFDFAGHSVSVTTTQLCLCGVKADRDNTKVNERGWVPVTIYLLTVVFEFQIIFTGHIYNFFSIVSKCENHCWITDCTKRGDESDLAQEPQFADPRYHTAPCLPLFACLRSYVSPCLLNISCVWAGTRMSYSVLWFSLTLCLEHSRHLISYRWVYG